MVYIPVPAVSELMARCYISKLKHQKLYKYRSLKGPFFFQAWETFIPKNCRSFQTQGNSSHLILNSQSKPFNLSFQAPVDDRRPLPPPPHVCERQDMLVGVDLVDEDQIDKIIKPFRKRSAEGIEDTDGHVEGEEDYEAPPVWERDNSVDYTQTDSNIARRDFYL